MAKKYKKPNWKELDPSIDNLLADGWSEAQIARDLGINPQTLNYHMHTRRKAEAPSEVPLREPKQVPIDTDMGSPQVPMGTDRGSLEGTAVDEEVDFPLADEGLRRQTLESLAEALLPLVLSGVETWLESRVPQRVPIGVFDTTEIIPMRRYPEGTPGYPDDPRKDIRLNLHLRTGELWEVHAVAEALHTNPSFLIRRLWADFMASPQGQEALQRYLAKMGTPAGTSEGSR